MNTVSAIFFKEPAPSENDSALDSFLFSILCCQEIDTVEDNFNWDHSLLENLSTAQPKISIKKPARLEKLYAQHF
jgi:hypothetical protein